MSMSIEDDFYFHFDKNIGSNGTQEGLSSPMTLYLRSQEFRRFKHASGNREDIARRGTLTQLHQRVSINLTRIYKDKQYTK